MSEIDIKKTYDFILGYYEKYLKDKNVKMPKLKDKKGYTKDALTLVYLAQGYPKTRPISKAELTSFIQKYYPRVLDVQQARHLGAQKGWYILSGTRKDIGPKSLKPGQYILKTLEECYPDFTGFRRVETEGDDYFEELKKAYGYRCATCGSEEGKPNLKRKNTITVLQKGHMDPSKPLEPGNIIPQCEKCNRADRNYWIYDAKGRVIAISNPAVVDRCSTKVQKEIYERLKSKFEGKK